VLVTWVPRDAANAVEPPVKPTLEVSDGIAQATNVFTWADHTLADPQYVVKVDPNIKKDVTAISLKHQNGFERLNMIEKWAKLEALMRDAEKRKDVPEWEAARKGYDDRCPGTNRRFFNAIKQGR